MSNWRQSNELLRIQKWIKFVCIIAIAVAIAIAIVFQFIYHAQ
jgi:hypothetical protein